MNQNDIQAVTEFLSAHDDFAIVCHENPDGDALGSMFALALALKKMGKRVQTICVDPAPHKYRHIEGISALITPEAILSFSHLICVDCADIERAGLSNEVINRALTVVNIDHHASNEGFGQYQLLSTEAAATGILIYRLLADLHTDIDSAMAQNLLIAISSDTGHFSHANTDGQCLSVAAELVSRGAKANVVAHEIFQVKTEGWVRLLGRAIASLELFCDGKAAVMTLSLQDFADAQAAAADVEGIIDTARNIETVNVAALIRETEEGDVKVSLRSNEDVDVNRIASAFSGGGHMRAAGFSIDATLNRAKQLVVSTFEMLECEQ